MKAVGSRRVISEGFQEIIYSTFYVQIMLYFERVNEENFGSLKKAVCFFKELRSFPSKRFVELFSSVWLVVIWVVYNSAEIWVE